LETSLILISSPRSFFPTEPTSISWSQNPSTISLPLLWMVLRGLSPCLYYNIDSSKCLCRNHRSTNNSNHSWAIKSLKIVLYFWDSRSYTIARRGQDPQIPKGGDESGQEGKGRKVDEDQGGKDHYGEGSSG